MTRYLIVNADDFGISAGVSRGILEGHQRGILTSTSAMVNLPDTPVFIRRAQQEAPRLGIGLHFTLSFGKPVSVAERVPSLVTADGRFCSTYETLQEMAKSFTAEDLRTELTAQFDRFVEIAGRLPDHLDSHHGITYTHPDAYDVMRGLAQQHQLPIRNESWFLDSGQDSAAAERLRKIHGTYPDPIWPQAFDPQPTFYDQHATLENLLHAIEAVPEGVSEFACHPGYGADLDETYAAPREQELAIVTSEAARTAIERGGIQLVNFGDLARLLGR